MKNILLLVHDDGGQESRYQVALDLARALDAHLTCLDLVYVPSVLGGGAYENAYVMGDVMTAEGEREKVHGAHLRSRLAQEDVVWDWCDAVGEPADALARAATLADLIVVSRKLDGMEMFDMGRAAADLIVRSGKPVLAVPADCPRFKSNTALVAWDGSSSAARALQAAIPLLAEARRVVVLEVDDGSLAIPATDAAAYLSRYGIHATIKRVPCGSGEAGGVLLEEASLGGFGYVVMGGFGHARWLEGLFGGVSRTMMKESPIPVLFAH
ncbi:universal stress protein [Sphingomonadaceae bacterium jetA1]|jgi:nucleotide-binding universal stress UspA family protein|uniref:universal stress protein n=1 Tax=Facivitalis istanbulensis TaxID=3075838 RepID=UPI0034870B42